MLIYFIHARIFCTRILFSRYKTEDIFEITSAIFMYLYENIVYVLIYLYKIYIHIPSFYEYMKELFGCSSPWCVVISCSLALDI